MRSATKNKTGKDPAYLAWIRKQACAVLMNDLRGVGPCVGPTEAHHAGDHGTSQKAPDRTAIPLCLTHHRDGKNSAHTLGKNFWKFHGIDRDRLIARLNEQYDERDWKAE